MRETDYREFSLMLDSVCSLLSKGAYAPNGTNTALWFRSLAAHDLAAVRAGFDAHVRDPQRGRFVPNPADILAQIVGDLDDDGRPGPEEAWALAQKAADEAATVVWTPEIAQAWGIARSVQNLGDDVGARMAFKEAYVRIVSEARSKREPLRWEASLGHDAAQRDEALQRAQSAGLLPPPAPVPQITGPERTSTHNGKTVAQMLADMRAKVVARMEAGQAYADDEARSIGKFQPVPKTALPPAMRGAA